MKIALELLDSDRGDVLQSWEFVHPAAVQVGRSKDCDVVIGSPYVSRSHGYLMCDGEAWSLHTLSRQGVFVEGARSEKFRLTDGMIFQLGERGPRLRFRNLDFGESHSGKETISFEKLTTPLLVLNESERDKEVHEIVEGDLFQKLQKLAGVLREKRSHER